MRSLLLLLLAGPVLSFGQVSELWGEKGEKWTAKSRLPDFSYAGYRFGEAQPPTPPVGASVKDFGAVGDGKTDDTAAFKKAVAEAAGKVILVPKGNYVLSDRIEISGIGTVLRGESRDESILTFTKGLEDLYPAPAKADHGKDTTNWSWSGGLLSIISQSLHSGPRVAVSSSANMGETKLQIENASTFKVGDFITVLWVNNEAAHLVKHLYDNDTGDASGVPATRNFSQVNKIVSIQGKTLELMRPLRMDVKPEYTCTVTKVDPRTTECGIEQLTLKFESGIYRAHFEERGYNAIAISPSCIHCWVRQVRIVDADSGIFGAGVHGTIDGVILEAKRKSLTPDNIKGHHGVDGGLECVIQNITFESSFFHDLSVGGGNTGNVFRLIQGEDINMDQHRWGPAYNLFTNIDLGAGKRPWLSGGGKNRGKHTARGTTFWNLRSKTVLEMPEPEFGPPPLQFVGLRMRGSDQKEDGKWWVESIPPAKIIPQDLYMAQLEKRLAEGKRMFDAPAPAGEALSGTAEKEAWHEWTNIEGKTIRARFLGVAQGQVKLALESGTEVSVAFSKLNEASQKQARDLFTQAAK